MRTTASSMSPPISISPLHVWYSAASDAHHRTRRRRVAHGDQRANLVLGFFNLGDMPGGTGNLREQAYPEADVAVIDFSGGVPSQQELAGLNRMNGQSHMLVLRSGVLVYGRFDNIIEGSTVTFTDQRGQRQEYSARDVSSRSGTCRSAGSSAG